MKSASPNRKRLFAPVNQFSFTAPPVAVQEFPLRTAAKRKAGLGCQTIQTDTNPRGQIGGPGLRNAVGRGRSCGESLDGDGNWNRTGDTGFSAVEP